MSDFKIEIPVFPKPEDVKGFYLGAHASNQNQTTVHEAIVRPTLKYFFLRNEDNEICGGLVANFVFDVLSVDVVWVADELRGRGLGARVYRAAEDLAYQQKKRRAVVSTFEYQKATGFWLKQGFQQFATLPGDLEGSQISYFSKTIDSIS